MPQTKSAIVRRIKVDITESALALPRKQRAALAAKLWESLESPVDPEIRAEHLAEVQRRIKAFERGEEEAIPAEDFLASSRNKTRAIRRGKS